MKKILLLLLCFLTIATVVPFPVQAVATPFSFGAVGDFGGIDDPDTAAFLDRMAAPPPAIQHSFLLALGDIGYTDNEQGWCNFAKSHFNNIIVIAGNHDTTESGPGDIDNMVNYCPFPLAGVTVNGVYGKEFYFDYPAVNPLARFILITAGVCGDQACYDYSYQSSHYNWVVSAVSSAPSAGIHWVFVGAHKQCLTVGDKSGCSFGQALFDKLVDMKVDMIMTAHDHTYQRTKLLSRNANCLTITSGGGFDADCVNTSFYIAPDKYVNDQGTIQLVTGTGGAGLYNLHSPSDLEWGYMDRAYGANTDNAHGFSSVYVAPTFLASQFITAYPTDFQPDPPLFYLDDPITHTFATSCSPCPVNQSITFTPTVSGGTPSYALYWVWGDGTNTSIGSATPVAHTYLTAGDKTVNVYVTDSIGFVWLRTQVVSVTTSGGGGGGCGSHCNPN